jgi:hypothetical protein
MDAQPTPPLTPAAAELLGLLGGGQVFGFHTLADAAARSSFDQGVRLAQMSTGHLQGYWRTRDRIGEAGLDADQVIAAHVPGLAAFHERTTPADELEALLKSYVGMGIASDFVREMAAQLDEGTAAFVVEVLASPDAGEVAVPRLREVLTADPAEAGRLALWGRRLMGEAMSQAMRVATDRPDLVQLMVGQDDLEGFGALVGRITAQHSSRMRSIGLYP